MDASLSSVLAKGDDAAVRRFLRGCPDGRLPEGAMTPKDMLLCVPRFSDATCLALIEAGAPHDHPLMLHEAVLFGLPRTVDALLRAGACPNTPPWQNDPESDKQEFLHTAILNWGYDRRTRHLRVFRRLLAAGADPNRACRFHSAPALHVAAGDVGSPVAVRLLLEAGAHPNAESDGRTPLHHAANGPFPSVVALLLAAGADPAARDDEGLSPLSIAVRCLEDLGTGPAALDMPTLRNHVLRCARMLLRAGAPLDEEEDGETLALLREALSAQEFLEILALAARTRRTRAP